MNRSVLWGMTGALLAGVITLAVAWPAHWLAPWVWTLSGQRIQMRETQGPWWAGRTRLVLWGGSGARTSADIPGEITWRIRLDGRDGLGATLHLHAPCCSSQGVEARLYWSSGWTWEIEDAQGSLDLSPLRGLGTPWNTLNLSGVARWEIKGMQGRERNGLSQVQGRASVELSDISSDVSSVAPLGTYKVSWEWQPQARANWTLSTVRGSLQLQGQGLYANGHLRFRGEAYSEPSAAGALSNLLNIIGRRQGAKSILSIG